MTRSGSFHPEQPVTCLKSKRPTGFSLVELAMVLFIISLVLGGLLVPLASQLEARQRNQAEEQLERIREALIGFALVYGRLPCPSTTTDPTDANYGVENSPCTVLTGQTQDWILPWKTLGLTNGLDPWGSPRTASADPWTGHWRYRLNSNFGGVFSLSTDPGASNILCVIDSNGNLMVTPSEPPVAIVYSTGADQTADGNNASYEDTSSSTDCSSSSPILYQGGPVSGDFDDMLTWISRPLLFNRMVTAGRLP